MSELKTTDNPNMDVAVIAAFRFFWNETADQRKHLTAILNSHKLFDTCDTRFDIADMCRMYAEQLKNEMHAKMERVRLT